MTAVAARQTQHTGGKLNKIKSVAPAASQRPSWVTCISYLDGTLAREEDGRRAMGSNVIRCNQGHEDVAPSETARPKVRSSVDLPVSELPYYTLGRWAAAKNSSVVGRRSIE